MVGTTEGVEGDACQATAPVRSTGGLRAGSWMARVARDLHGRSHRGSGPACRSGYHSAAASRSGNHAAVRIDHCARQLGKRLPGSIPGRPRRLKTVVEVNDHARVILTVS